MPPTADEPTPLGTELSPTVQRSLATVLSWTSQADCVPLSAEQVPGASKEERRRLAALGAAVGQLWSRRAVAPRWLTDISPVAEWIGLALEVPDRVLESLSAVAHAGPDGIARLYDLVVHATARRHLGTFFTPLIEARWMIARWQELFDVPGSVVDIGAGVGVFISEARHQWPRAQLVPVDINPVTLGLISLLEIQTKPGTESLKEQLEPVLGDFAAWSQQGFDELRPSRLILGNPPYTRLQLIPPEQRQALLAAAGDLCGSRASLSALMLGTALSILHAEDGVCLLLPAQWLESDYAVGLRDWVWRAVHRRIELHLFESRLFRDAQVDAVALFVGPKREALQSLAFSTASSPAGTVASRPRAVDRTGMTPARWRRLFTDVDTTPTEPGRLLVQFCEIHRGTATGANFFFTLSERDASEARLPPQVLRPFLQRTRDHKANVVMIADLQRIADRSKRYMFVATPADLANTNVAAYVAQGEAAELHLRHLTSARPVWYALGSEVRVPDVIIAASSRSGFAVLENAAGAAITNNLYGLHWRADIPDAQRRAVLDWLRSPNGQRHLLAAARRQAEGLCKLEIADLRSLLVPTQVAVDSGRRAD